MLHHPARHLVHRGDGLRRPIHRRLHLLRQLRLLLLRDPRREGCRRRPPNLPAIAVPRGVEGEVEPLQHLLLRRQRESAVALTHGNQEQVQVAVAVRRVCCSRFGGSCRRLW